MGSSSRTYLYLFIIALGIANWLLYLYDTFKNRLKKKIEIQMRFTMLSFIFLTGVLLIAFCILIFSNKQGIILYGVYIFMGWLSALIIGKTFKTLPFIVWNYKYKSIHGKMKIPMPKDLYIEKWIQYQYWLFISAMVILTIGILLQLIYIIRLGLLIWILIAILYIVNVFKVIFHKVQIHNDTTITNN